MKQFYKYILTLVAILMVTTPAWASDCTYTKALTGSTYTSKDFNQTICSTTSEAPNVAISITYTIYLKRTTLGKSLTYTLYAIDSSGQQHQIASGLKVSNGGTETVTQTFTLNKDITSYKIDQTSEKFGSNREITISNVTVTYKYASSLTTNNSNLTIIDTPVGASRSVSFSVDYQNSTNNETLVANESSDVNNSFSISPSSKNITDCSGFITYTITFSPQSEQTNATATYVINGNGSSLTVTVTATSFATVKPEYTCMIANSYMVDDPAIDLNALWTSTSPARKDYKIETWTPSGSNNTNAVQPAITNNTLSLGQAGRLILSLSQTEVAGYYADSDTKTIIINKYSNNTISNDLATEYMVDDIIPEADIYTINNNEVPVQIISGNESILKFENGQLKAVGAGTTTITVKQTENYKWVERSATKTITVHKFDINPNINPNTAYWNEHIPNPFTATTTHRFNGATHSITDFSVTQQDNEHIATLNNANYNIQTYYTNGAVDFLITRPEDYKYNALNQTVTLTVNQSKETCFILEDLTERNWATINNSGDYTIPTGTPDSLFFQAQRTPIWGVTNSSDFYAQYKTADGEWTRAMTINLENKDTWYNLSCDIPDNAKYIRFITETGATGNKHIQNVCVTRKKFLTPSESPVELAVTSIGTPESKTFTINWSTCADEILLTNSNPHFTLNTYRIQPTNNEGNTTITVTCDATAVGTLRDTIIIYDQTQMLPVPVVCEVNDKFIANIKGTTSYSKMVDDTWVADFRFDTCQTTLPSADINAPLYYTIDHDLTGNYVQKPGFKNQVITYDPESNTIIAHNAGTAVLTFIQQPTNSHYTDTLRCTITVSKYDVKRIWNDPVYFNDTIYNYFTTSNTDSTIVIESQTDTDVAKLTNEFNPTSNNSLDLITFNKEASTTVTVSQAETYYWNGYSELHTITPIDPNNHVTFTLTQENYISAFRHSFVDPAANDQSKGPDWENEGIYFGGEGLFEATEGWNWDEKYFIIQFTGIPDSIYFDASRSDAATRTINLSVSEGKTHDNLTEVWSNSNNTENNNIKRKLNPDTRYLKLSYIGNLWGLFKNITVTELNEFRAVEVDNHEVDVEFLNFDSIQVNTSKTMSFAFKYANAGYKVELISTDPHFTINPSSITDIGGENHGTRQIDVTYTSSVPHATNEDAMIIISDEHGHKDTVQLIASAYKLKQTLRWRSDFEAVEKPLIPLNGGNISDAAYSTSGLTIKYLSDNSNVIAISDDGTTLIPMGEGEATITATQTGNELWNPAESITKTFVVTDKRLQYIIWNDPLSDLVKSDNNQTITLTAKVHVQTKNGQIVESHEQTAKLTYQSANTSIVSVSGSLLTIHSVGKTTLTAHVPATDDFAAATLTVPVIVRPETAGCEDVLLLDENGPIQFFQYSLNEIIKEAMPLDLNKGIPGYVLVEHYGESWDLAIQYYAAEIRVEESTDGGNSWNTITTIYPAEDKVNIDSIPLSRTATHIRFARNSGGQGYQFLQNIKVHPAQFIEGPDVIDFGQIHVGSREEQTFTIAYSNIKSTLSPVVSSTDVIATPNSFGECGEFGTQTIQVFWTPSQLGENMQETVTFTDFNSGMEKVVILRAQNIQKGSQQLNWDAPEIIEHCGHIHFPEQTTAHLPIKWEVIDGNQYADFVNGTLTLFQNGKIQIKGSNKGSSNYEPFEQIYPFQIIIDPIFMGTEDEDWNNTNNWNICRLPYEHEAVTIQASTVLTKAISIAGITFAMGDNGNLGSIHITATGGLTVGAQGITGAATDGSSITIDNFKTGAGFLRISPEYKGTMPRTRVNYQTRSTLDMGANKDATWQYFGTPGNNVEFTVDYITWLYHWSETQGWIKQNGTLTFAPFAGYAITQYGKPTYSLIAEPICNDQTITLTKTTSGMNGDNLFANSYMAPIDVKNFTADDFTGNVDKTFYLFNSGSWNQWNGQNEAGSTLGNNGSTTPGQYCAIPALSAKYLDSDITTLPPMQGVYVIANENGATIRLNYDKHVWQAGTYTDASTRMNEPMRAPQREAQEQMQRDDFLRIRLQVNSANSGADRMYIIQEHTTTRDYDNGYDAPNQFAEGIANIYTSESFGKMEVSCANNIDSTYIGFQAGADSQYTLSVSSLIGNGLYLKDLSNDSIFLLTEGGQYHFTAQPLSTNDLRFQVLLNPMLNNEDSNAGVTTDMNDIADTRIWHNHNQLYITNAPTNSALALYNTNGQLILSYTTQQPTHTIDLNYLHKGVYILQLNNQMYKFVRQ